MTAVPMEKIRFGKANAAVTMGTAQQHVLFVSLIYYLLIMTPDNKTGMTASTDFFYEMFKLQWCNQAFQRSYQRVCQKLVFVGQPSSHIHTLSMQICPESYTNAPHASL